MKEILSTQNISGYNNSFVGNNGETSVNSMTNDNNTRRYAVLSTEWISAIGEELGMHPLSDSVLRRLAEDASYRLREILHKCITRLKHSRRKCLTSNDVNAVLTNLCDVDPILGAPDTMPEYHSEAKVFVPNERIINLVDKVNEAVNLSQDNVPFIQEVEVCDVKLTEARYNYAKRALKTLFNGSQKTFQVLVNDCATNPYLGGEGVIDRLMSIARSMVISNNAQYTRVSTRTCQLIIAIASNSEAVYPYYLTSVDKLTELLLELLLGQSFINLNLEALFKECALKLMLRWPSVADKYIPTLEEILLKEEKESMDVKKKRMAAMELLASVQPLLFFQSDKESLLFIDNILKSAPSGSVIWQRMALAVCALLKSGAHRLDLSSIIEHYGDSLLPYLPVKCNNDTSEYRKSPTLPIILKSKIKYAKVRPVNTKVLWDRQSAFPDSTLKGPRKEIRFAFAGGRPVPPSNLRRVSLRANYQILRSEHQATLALVASRRLLVLRNTKKKVFHIYNLAHICL
ncbi:uncharacterized protein LOC122636962 [Vespula pensylvanica]|uniref:Transcription initiation factor TFIID subunit 6 n=1 Tax=Vespula pensylvanica TaxID=30213 RepID=A0A834JIP2_VESPE|nr:uncharacterized protein LOC122636962 [Vespula pensylvanica]KAF7389458.1 hypothetical protein H0235_017942 [Vespula pensylvanica]